MEKQQILKEKFDREREFITNILKKCTKNTYVETFAEQGPVSGNERTYVSHHILPSGLHVYRPTKVLDRVAEHREFDKPFDDRDTSATYYILTDEIKDLKGDPKGIYLFRGKQAGIEYTKSLGEEKIIYGVDSYIRKDGNSLIRDWKVQAALRDISGYHRLGGYKRDLAYSAYVIQRGDCMRNINKPEDEMTSSLRELIEESKLSEDIKLAYLTEIEKLSAMLEKERKALSNEDNSEKETAIGPEFEKKLDEYMNRMFDGERIEEKELESDLSDEGIEGDVNAPTGEFGPEFEKKLDEYMNRMFDGERIEEKEPESDLIAEGIEGDEPDKFGPEFEKNLDEYMNRMLDGERIEEDESDWSDGIEGDGNEPTDEIGAEFAKYGYMDLADDKEENGENNNEEERRRCIRETIKNLKKLGITEGTIIKKLENELRALEQDIEKEGPDQRENML